MKIDNIKVTELKYNPYNPRTITEENFDKLKQSIKNFTKMLELRPIIIDSNNIVLGGNMRLKACKELGIEEVPVIRADNFSQEEIKEFIAKDNVGYGEWDYEALLEQYDLSVLEDYAIDVPNTEIDIDSETEYSDDKVELTDYTIYFESQEEEDIWFGFLAHLKDKFKNIDSISERILCYIQNVYEENKMSESQMILKFLKCDKEVIEDES